MAQETNAGGTAERNDSCMTSFDTSSMTVFLCQAEAGIRVKLVTGVQTCALPISIGIVHFGNNMKCQHQSYAGDGRACEDSALCVLFACRSRLSAPDKKKSRRYQKEEPGQEEVFPKIRDSFLPTAGRGRHGTEAVEDIIGPFVEKGCLERVQDGVPRARLACVEVRRASLNQVRPKHAESSRRTWKQKILGKLPETLVGDFQQGAQATQGYT